MEHCCPIEIALAQNELQCNPDWAARFHLIIPTALKKTMALMNSSVSRQSIWFGTVGLANCVVANQSV